MDIILASQSPRRQELLKLLVPEFKVCPANADESAVKGEAPPELVVRLAELKAKAVGCKGESAVIGCDTIVALNGKIIGKPKNEADAVDIITRLSGKAHFVHTGVCILHRGGTELFCETTKVIFAEIPHNDICLYAKTSEPYDKAGGYGIQGWAAKYITGIEGCYFNVMGLPVAALYEKLRKLGLA